MNPATIKYKFSTLRNLPKLVSNKFKINNTVAYTGTIIRRRIDGPFKVYWHYAFIYGFDENNQVHLIENTNIHGVRCVTLSEFTSKTKHWECYHYQKKPGNITQIMERAHKLSYYMYDAQDNNCEHFVNFCLFEKLESIQSETTRKIAGLSIAFLEIRLMLTPGEAAKDLLKQCNDLRDKLNLPREKSEFNDFIRKRISEE